MQPQQIYDFSSDENSHKWRGLFVQALRKVMVSALTLPTQSPQAAVQNTVIGLDMDVLACMGAFYWLTFVGRRLFQPVVLTFCGS